MFKYERLIRKIVCGIAVVFLFSGAGVSAQEDEKEAFELDEIVVTATKTETSVEHIANSVTIITGEQVENKGKTTVSDVLKDISGIAISQCGGTGNYTTIRMRGGQDRHVKFLINGMAVGDYATGITTHYDLWNFLGTSDIERIEVIRGPQSALYGSDAISGVINIITKKGSGEPQYFIKGEVGSMDTRKVSGGVNGSTGKLSYKITLSHDETGGVLKYSEYESDMISMRFGYQFNEDTEVDLSLQYTDSSLNMGGQSSSTTWKVYDDPNAYRKAKLFYSSLDFKQKVTPFWEHQLTIGYDREEKNPYDLDDGVLDVEDNIVDKKLIGEYINPVKKVYWQNNFFLGSMDTLTAGVEYQDIDVDRESTSSTVYSCIKRSVNTKSIYLQNQLLLMDENLSIICGSRVDDDSAFGKHTTYSSGLAYLLRDYGTKIKVTYGTGFSAPSIFNLYHPEYGNADLDPEESKSWDAGIEQNFYQGRVILEAVYFDNKFKNLVTFDYPTYRYTNRDEAESHGIEVGLQMLLLKDFSGSINYTYTKGKEDGADLANVPEDNWTFNATYNPGKFSLSADLYFVGDRLAYNQLEENRLDSYKLVNISSSYQINSNVNIFARVENLLDEEYMTSLPWKAPGRAGYGGVKITF